LIDWKQFGPHPIFGLDEVGRGCLAGPVVSAAATPKLGKDKCPSFVVLSPDLPEGDPHLEFYQSFFKQWIARFHSSPPTLGLEYLTDSKKLNDKKRKALMSSIVTEYRVCIGISSPYEIDQINILQASLLSMHRAAFGLQQALSQQANHLLIDGKFKLPRWKGSQTPIIKGDLKCPLISVSSIVAKVFRDGLMEQLDLQYPGYGFADHKGYPSPSHKKSLAQLGPSRIHRKSFKGVLPSIDPVSFESRTF
jgi:ribonuclease HII